MELAERINLRLSDPALKLTQAGLARACLVSRPSVNAWVSGKSKSIDGKYLTTAATYLGVNPHWLATGKGEMLPSDVGHRDVMVAGQVQQRQAAELAQALEKVETVLEQIKASPSASNTVHIEHAWPFKGIKRDQWENLTPEQKAIVESVASGFLIQHAAGASASHTEKRQATG